MQTVRRMTCEAVIHTHFSCRGTLVPDFVPGHSLRDPSLDETACGYMENLVLKSKISTHKDLGFNFPFIESRGSKSLSFRAMESYLQYRRIRQAVRRQLAEIESKCSCEGYTIGSPHYVRYVRSYSWYCLFLSRILIKHSLQLPAESFEGA